MRVEARGVYGTIISLASAQRTPSAVRVASLPPRGWFSCLSGMVGVHFKDDTGVQDFPGSKSRRSTNKNNPLAALQTPQKWPVYSFETHRVWKALSRTIEALQAREAYSRMEHGVHAFVVGSSDGTHVTRRASADHHRGNLDRRAACSRLH